MSRRILVAALAATLTLGITYAARTPGQASTPSSKKIVIPVNKTDASDGREMFGSYCAPCHGTDGRGHGPAAPALKPQPTDLTLLSKNNNGKFPDAHLSAVLQFGSEIPAHGSAQMPVWGPILSRMSRGSSQEKQQRISNIGNYVKTIQVR